MSRLIRGLAERIVWLLEVSAELALAGLLVLVAHEVFVRYVLDHPTVFSVEISEYLLVFIAFMSAGWVLRQDQHVRVVFCVARLPARGRALANMAAALAILIFCAVLVRYGGAMAAVAWSNDSRSSSLVAFPLWIAYAVIPVGAAALGIQALLRLAEAIRELRRAKPRTRA
jgi:C4-dicarboxylate transporter DctQ subunit